MKTLPIFSKYIHQKANLPWLLLLMVLMFGLGILVISPLSPSAELMTLANGRNVPDTQFNRSAADFYSQMSAYGTYGRRLYLTRISPVDLFIPITQALFLSVGISLALRCAFAPESSWQLLNLLPFLAMVGDYLENISMVVLMLAYPTPLMILATLSGLFTAVKFIFSIAGVISIIFGIIICLVRRAARVSIDHAK